MRPLPLFPLQPLLAAVISSVLKRHPDIFDRLGDYAGKTFGLNPTDLPFAFVLELRSGQPAAHAVRELPEMLDARISGPMAALVGLLDGSYDGDALFFSRDLVVEGDVEATLALRNAVDDAQIDLAGEIASQLGPFSRQAEIVIRKLLESIERHKKPEAPQWN
jgi:Putative lipid carrier protein